MTDLTFDQVKPLIEQIIEQLPSSELNRLRDWINSAEADQPIPESDSLSWGERLVALVNTFDLDTTGLGWNNEDPEIWVSKQRRTQTSRRNPGWGDE